MRVRAPYYERRWSEHPEKDPPPRVDVLIERAGRIALFHLVTERAQAWARRWQDRGWYQIFGGALVVDHDHANAFAKWMRAEGLDVEIANVAVCRPSLAGSPGRCGA